MDNNDKKVLELVVFWLAVVHVIVSMIMTYVNCGKSKSQNKTQKGSKKQKDFIENSIQYFENIINNNCFMWVISFLVCLAIVILAGFCIWGDDEDDDSKK